MLLLCYVVFGPYAFEINRYILIDTKQLLNIVLLPAYLRYLSSFKIL